MVEPSTDVTSAGLTSATPAAGGWFHVELDRVVPNPHQPRQRWDDGSLDGLAASIREQGVMQPIVVRPAPTGEGYELIAGERRWRAAQRAGLAAVPALLRELNDAESAQWALVENVQREDLNAMDRAEAVQSLVDQFELTHAEVAERLGLQRATITNLTRLLSLAPTVREMVRDGLLSMGHARALAGLSDPKHQAAIAERVVREGLSVRQVESAVRAFHVEPPAVPATPAPAPPAHLAELERNIADRLGLRVRLRTGRKKGTGSLEIKFTSLNDFDALLHKLGLDASLLAD
jgi:ParB family chromosome partitioning protein